MINLEVDGKKIDFVGDSGAAVILISNTRFECLLSNVELHKTDLQLFSYCKSKLPLLGYATISMLQSRQKENKLNF